MFAALQAARNSRRTLAASRAAPVLVVNTRSWSLHRAPAVCRSSSCRSFWSWSASTAIWGSARVRRDFSVLVSPWDRPERHTAALAEDRHQVRWQVEVDLPGSLLRLADHDPQWYVEEGGGIDAEAALGPDDVGGQVGDALPGAAVQLHQRAGIEGEDVDQAVARRRVGQRGEPLHPAPLLTTPTASSRSKAGTAVS